MDFLRRSNIEIDKVLCGEFPTLIDDFDSHEGLHLQRSVPSQ